MQLNSLQTRFGRWLDGLPEGLTTAPIVLAVSGGSDSLALLHLMQACSVGCDVNLIVVTVDHGLRKEAVKEARFVKSVCDGLDITHETLIINWAGETPSQSRARIKRYQVLSRYAQQSGARLILTGHTEDDQAETHLIRKAAQSGWWGLAGMSDLAPLPVWPEGVGVCLGRPLLGESRAQLRVYLRERGIRWVDDPSNENPVFERVRVRRKLSDDPDLKSQCLREVKQLQVLRNKMADALLDWEARHIHWFPGGSVSFPFAAFDALGVDAQFRLLQHVLPCVSGLERQPRSDALKQILDGDAAVQGTLCGCQFSKQRDDVLITPEVMNPGDIVPLDDTLIWAGRVSLSRTGTNDGPLYVAPWAERPVPERLKSAPDLSFRIRQALPVILDAKGGIVEVPHLETAGKIKCHDPGRNRFRRWLNAKTM